MYLLPDVIIRKLALVDSISPVCIGNIHKPPEMFSIHCVTKVKMGFLSAAFVS